MMVTEFSPQAWGCTASANRARTLPLVFPTGVGVYRVSGNMVWDRWRFPHRRGGVPFCVITPVDGAPFSPQAWGCTA